MALRTADDDPTLNPGQQHSDNQFNDLKKAESESAAGSNSDNGSSQNNVKNAEENPSGEWQNNVSGSKPSTIGGKFNGLKKKGPLTTIILTLVGGGLGIGGLLSPGLLIIQLKEVMVNKFNSQLSSMDIRTNKILTSKTTGGISCGKIINIGCKYSSMSEKQIANFEKAGITVESESKTILGRTKPKSFKFNGETIKASEFASKLESSAEFRSAVKVGYNPKFAGFADSFWGKAAQKLGITKAKANIDTSSEQKALKSIQEDTKTKSTVQESEVQPIKEGETKPDGSTFTAAEEAANKTAVAAGEVEGGLAEDAAKIAEKATKTGSVALEGVEVAGSALKITGLTDAACTAYGAIQGLGYAAKSIRALQLAKYAMIFLNVADQIKAGVAKPEDVSYLGTVLTTEVKETKKTATDSFGYKYAAYGEAGKMPTSATQYLAGGGLAGSLIGITGVIDKNLPANKKVCGVLKNPFVAGASLVVGIGLFFVPGANVAIGAWDIAKGVGIAALTIATAYIPAALGDIVAGVLVDKTTVGESAGDAITSGASGMMGTTANTRGNAPLTPDQAIAYNNLSNTIAAQYAEEDRLALSPFDITNSNTFMGSIVAKLIPYASKVSSLSGAFSSLASLTSGSISSIAGQVKASDGGYDYKGCQDFDYRELGLATDPYCNVVYGIAPDALETSPLKINTALSGEIDPVSGDPLPDSAYETFVADCINRNRPLGDVGEDPNGSNGSECIFGAEVTISGSTQKKNNNYYVHYIDQGIEKGMSGDDPVLAAAEASGQTSLSFFVDDNYSTTADNSGSGL